jgi:hypothetical protein
LSGHVDRPALVIARAEDFSAPMSHLCVAASSLLHGARVVVWIGRMHVRLLKERT